MAISDIVGVVKKKALKLVGDFVEFGYDRPGAQSIAQHRGKRKPTNKEQVVNYLRSCPWFVVSPGIEDDVFDPSKCAGPYHILTDGEYAWRKTLAYYVDMYDVELPAEFEKHMQRNRWVVPTDVQKLALELPRSS